MSAREEINRKALSGFIRCRYVASLSQKPSKQTYREYHCILIPAKAPEFAA
jgi:hypothetical protein